MGYNMLFLNIFTCPIVGRVIPHFEHEYVLGVVDVVEDLLLFDRLLYDATYESKSDLYSILNYQINN